MCILLLLECCWSDGTAYGAVVIGRPSLGGDTLGLSNKMPRLFKALTLVVKYLLGIPTSTDTRSTIRAQGNARKHATCPEHYRDNTVYCSYQATGLELAARGQLSKGCDTEAHS